MFMMRTLLTFLLAVGLAGSLAGPLSAVAAPTAGTLVGHWQMDEGSGTTLTDSSGNGYNMSFNAGVMTYTANAAATGFANPAALEVLAAGTAARGASANIDNLQSLSLALWVRPETLAGAGNNRFVTLSPEKAVLRAQSGSLHFYMTIDGGIRSVVVPGALVTNTWQHIAGTYDGFTLRLYHNGVLVGATAYTGTVNTGTSLFLSSGSEAFDGQLDDLRIYNGTLSAAEVAALASSGPCFAEYTGDNVTDYASADASALRNAVSAVAAGGTVKVAGYCAGGVYPLQAPTGAIPRVVYITKTLTLQGGYTATTWATSDPTANPTTLDALNDGRAVYATAAVTLDGLTLRNGRSYDGGGGGGVYASGELTLTAMTLYSNTTTANGGGAYIFGRATISGTAFTSNTSSGSGGGAYFRATAYLTSTTFSNNLVENANNGGGAYFFDEVNAAYLTNTTFSANTAHNGGGAYIRGAAWIINATFTSNTANASGGGAYFLTRVDAVNTVFRSNTATSNGGGVYIENPNAQQFVNSLFANNEAVNGAALYTEDPSPLRLIHLTIAHPTFSNRSAIYVANGSVVLSNSLVASHTVGIERAGGTVTEDYNLFANVTTPYSTGVTSGGHSITGTAGFYDTTGYTLTSSSAAIDTGTNAGVTTDYFGDLRPQGGGYDIGYDEWPATEQCYATPNDGGTVYTSTDASAVRAAIAVATSGATVKVAGYCAGVATEGGTTQVARITQPLTLAGGYTTTNWNMAYPLTQPTTLDAAGGGRGLWLIAAATVQDLQLINGFADGGGGLVTGMPITLSNVTLANNTANNGAGGGALFGNVATVINSAFLTNTATGGANDGGGAFFENQATIVNSRFSANTAPDQGGGVWVRGVATVVSSTFSANTTPSAGAGGLFADVTQITASTFSDNRGGTGAGAYFVVTATLTSTTFSANTSTVSGGGAHFVGAATLTATAFLSNTAASGGGGASFNSSLLPVTLTLSSFISNTAGTEGGGLVAHRPVWSENNWFSRNLAGGFGGAVYASATLTDTASTFQSNQAGGSGWGGGAYVQSAAAWLGTQFISNTAARGGGLFVNNAAWLSGTTFISNTASGSDGGGAQIQGFVTVQASLFQSNTASAAAGGLYASGLITDTIFSGNRTSTNDGAGLRANGAVTLTNVTFEGNVSGRDGGGAMLYSTAALSQVAFLNNRATDGGGGAYLASAGARRIVNTLFAANTAATGAALYVNQAALELLHSTIVSPTLAGNQAIYVTNGTVYLTNTLVASHTVGLQRASGTVSENYNLFSHVTTPYNGGISSGGNSLTGTAAFYNTTGYTLTASSAAIDRGTNLGVTTDYFGNLRPQGTGYDIGYAESPYTLTYLITPTAGVGGVITPATPQAVAAGSAITFTIAPNAGYSIAGVWVDGVAQGVISSYTFSNVTANHTLSAAFAINTYVITPTAGVGGSLSPATPQTVNYGSSLTFTITPNTGYSIAGVWADGVAQGVISSYTFSNVTANHTISAAFALNTYSLTVATAGTGSGVVTPTVGTYTYTHGTVVTLTAAANVSSTFAGWSGACSGTGSCVVTMTGNQNVTANFMLNTYTLTVATAGTGSGVVTPTVGTYTYTPGTVVTLTASANVGSTFTGWSGACSGTGSCVVTMNSAQSVTANFALNTYTLTVATAGMGSGVVTPTVGTYTYTHGTVVTLTASANVGSTFTGWSGACSGTGSCVVTMMGDQSVTANFALTERKLYLPFIWR